MKDMADMIPSSDPNKGFTLIELLVVIGVVAMLSVITILTLNPAELLRQARDANRIVDLRTLKSAIILYVADSSSPTIGTSTNCHFSTTPGTATSSCASRFTSPTIVVSSTAANATKVDATGWVPVDFTAVNSRVPLSHLPIDPINNSSYFYAYNASSAILTFELNANMESSRYANSGSRDVESTDGGNNDSLYEAGNAQGLAL